MQLELPSWLTDKESRVGCLAGVEEAVALAIELSAENVERGTGGPFGAVVYASCTGKVIALGINRVVPEGHSLLHGEVVAILRAQAVTGSYDLGASGLRLTLATSAQPCIQCFGALWWSGLSGLAFGATAEDVQRLVGFDEGPVPDNWREACAGKGIAVSGPHLRSDACRVLQVYADRGGALYNPSKT